MSVQVEAERADAGAIAASVQAVVKLRGAVEVLAPEHCPTTAR